MLSPCVLASTLIAPLVVQGTTRNRPSNERQESESARMCKWLMGRRQTSGIGGGNNKAVDRDNDRLLVHSSCRTTADKLLISKWKSCPYVASI